MSLQHTAIEKDALLPLALARPSSGDSLSDTCIFLEDATSRIPFLNLSLQPCLTRPLCVLRRSVLRSRLHTLGLIKRF